MKTIIQEAVLHDGDCICYKLNDETLEPINICDCGALRRAIRIINIIINKDLILKAWEIHLNNIK